MSNQWPPQGGGYQPPQGQVPQQWAPPGPPQGYGPPSYGAPLQQVVIVQQPGATIIQKAPFNHGLHLVITLCTCGLWLPVWIVLALVH